MAVQTLPVKGLLQVAFVLQAMTPGTLCSRAAFHKFIFIQHVFSILVSVVAIEAFVFFKMELMGKGDRGASFDFEVFNVVEKDLFRLSKRR